MNQITPDISEGALSSVMGLTLAQLKNVARNEHLHVSGSKGLLQGRIKTRISDLLRRNDSTGFFRVKYFVEHPDAPPPSNASFSSSQSAAVPMHLYNTSSAYTTSPSTSNGATYPPRLLWKTSPFYQVLQPVAPVQECKVRESTRDSFECKIKLPQVIIEKFASQTSGQDLRLMIYCTAEPVSSFAASDITFPQSIEIKVNGNEVKANLRGLKNKPGSTRPADVTDLIHKKPNYTNILTVTYALTTKKFYLVVNLVNKISPEILVKEVQSRPRISKEAVLREMLSKAQDSEIQATSAIMSLKCPLSTLRMDVPCRSTHCSHNQCYDALSFLQLQEQAPTWTCPICNKVARFETIHVDGYVSSILEASPRSVEQVSIEPNGDWSSVTSDPLAGHGQTSGSDDPEEDDDLVEIHEPPKIGSLRSAPCWTPSSVTRTPPAASSREQSITSASVRSSGSKRPASAVIDLTFSSDEEELAHPAKRQSLSQPIHLPAPPAITRQTTSSEGLAPPQQHYVSGMGGSGISFSMYPKGGYVPPAHRSHPNC